MTERGPVRIQEVARRAKVSSATVSRVLSNKPHVREELKERVLRVVQDMGYEPNRIARSLRVQRSSVIGLIISDIRNSFFQQLARAVEDIAYQNGYAVFLCNSDEDPEKESLYVNVLRAERVAGVIMSPTRETTHACKSLLGAGIPVVAIDRSILGTTLDSVLTDNSEATYKLISHLINQGHRRIGGVFSDLGITTGRERFEGYKRAHREAGLPLDDDLIRTGLPVDADGYRLAKSLLEPASRPTALFTGSKLLSYGALHAVYDLGLAIPKDIAFASFDKLDWMPSLPTMSYAEQPAYDLGKTATQLLLNRFETPGRTVQKVVLESTLSFDTSSSMVARPP